MKLIGGAMGHLCGRNMESNMSWMKKCARALVVFGAVSALSVWAQPTPAPTTGDEPCDDEPAGAGVNDTVVSSPDDSGYYNLFDGTFKGWWHSCKTGHSSSATVGAIFRIGTADGKPAIYSTQRGTSGGLLMTKKKFTNYEIVITTWPDFQNDGGLFNRTPANGRCFQTVLDYIGGAAVGGTWGEGGFTGRDYRPFAFGGDEQTISIPGNGNGELSNWTTTTSKLNPTSYGCAASGCLQADWRRLWDFDGWNQFKIQFYGGSAAGTGNIHMKAWFRKFGATTWVPTIQDTTLVQVVPAGYLGLQVHGGGRFGGPKGTWYKAVMWRPMNDKGEVIINHSTAVAPETGKAKFDLSATANALVGSMDKDYEIAVQDLKGRTLESFSGRAGKINHAFASDTFGWLSLRIKTSHGVESMRVLRTSK
jgi:hypothetical protein